MENFIKKRLQHECFRTKFLRTPFSTEQLQGNGGGCKTQISKELGHTREIYFKNKESNLAKVNCLKLKTQKNLLECFN